MGEIIHDRGRGPELIGTRITVYNLLPYFLDPAATEEYICRAAGVTPEQLAAARAYILRNADSVLAEHLKIEARIGAGNPAEFAVRVKQSHAKFQEFREWLAARETVNSLTGAGPAKDEAAPSVFPTFHEWLAERELGSAEGA